MDPKDLDAEAMKVNLIIKLMEQDQIEEALFLINRYFSDLSNEGKYFVSYNVLFEATKQYDMRPAKLPESFYDYLASDESNGLFFSDKEIADLNLGI